MPYKDPEIRRTKGRESQRALRARNPERTREQSREYNRRYYTAERRMRQYEQMRVWRMLHKHGLRPEDWAAMWDAQAGLCYLCGEALTASTAVVDHDHSCCEAERSCRTCRRGLAHPNCNSAVGMANDDPVFLRRLADALEHAQAEVAARMATKPAQLELGA